MSTPLSHPLELWLAPPEAAGMLSPDKLDAADRERLHRLQRPQRQQELLASRALMRTAVTAGQSFSLSHSGGWAAVLTGAAGMRIGVDLEVHRPRNWLRLARLAFTADEAAALGAAPAGQGETHFYALWTMKEALAKALGLELAQALTDCRFTLTSDGQWRARLPTDQPWSLQVFAAGPGITLAAACIGQQPPIRHWQWPPRQRTHWPLVASAGS